MSWCHGIGATEISKSIRQPEYLSDRYAVFTGCLQCNAFRVNFFGPSFPGVCVRENADVLAGRWN